MKQAVTLIFIIWLVLFSYWLFSVFMGFRITVEAFQAFGRPDDMSVGAFLGAYIGYPLAVLCAVMLGIWRRKLLMVPAILMSVYFFYSRFAELSVGTILHTVLTVVLLGIAIYELLSKDPDRKGAFG